MLEEIVMDAYVNLAGAIVDQAQKDAVKKVGFRRQFSTTGLYISQKTYTEAVEFLQSEYCKQIKEVCQEWQEIRTKKGVVVC